MRLGLAICGLAAISEDSDTPLRVAMADSVSPCCTVTEEPPEAAAAGAPPGAAEEMAVMRSRPFEARR